MKWEAYLSRAMPLLPGDKIRDALKKRDVKANGMRVGREDKILREADVCLYTDFDITVPVVFSDNKVILINKPAGLSSDTDRYGGMTVQNVLEDGMGMGTCLPVHRLDNRTCGLMLLARDGETLNILTDVFRQRESVRKQYLCIVKGVMRPERAIREAWLIKNAASSSVRIISHNTPGSKNIMTEYETVATDGTRSMLLITLHTGRTHQIRAHMASLGHPVVGDDLYGDRQFNKRFDGRLCLCSCKIAFDQTVPLEGIRGKVFSVDAPFAL